jgi:hypothetical protein
MPSSYLTPVSPEKKKAHGGKNPIDPHERAIDDPGTTLLSPVPRSMPLLRLRRSTGRGLPLHQRGMWRWRPKTVESRLALLPPR